MPPQQELQEHVTELRTTVYGVYSQGGLVSRVEKVEERIDDHEKRLSAISAKWLILMLLAGALGNALGSSLLQQIIKTLTN